MLQHPFILLLSSYWLILSTEIEQDFKLAIFVFRDCINSRNWFSTKIINFQIFYILEVFYCLMFSWMWFSIIVNVSVVFGSARQVRFSSLLEMISLHVLFRMELGVTGGSRGIIINRYTTRYSLICELYGLWQILTFWLNYNLWILLRH